MRKPKGYWNDKNNCKKHALECKSRWEFSRKYARGYNVSIKNDWIDEVCSHMIKESKVYWTKERCQEVALLYKHRIEFYKKNGSAYNSALKNGWLDEICSHMKDLCKHRGYWTKERCHEVALKCKTRSEFKKFGGAYYSAGRNGWIDEICSHMEIIGNIENKFIYVYIFEDNHAYVGLTQDLNDRNQRHHTDETSAVYKHLKKCPKYELKLLTELLPVQLAVEKEDYFIEYYRKKGFNMLNIAKAGSTGGNVIKWTKENCHEMALKCKSRYEFSRKFGGAYNSALKNGWLDEICSHMKVIVRPKGFWTIKENCRIESLKYESRSAFWKMNRTAYDYSNKNNWLDEFFPK